MKPTQALRLNARATATLLTLLDGLPAIELDPGEVLVSTTTGFSAEVLEAAKALRALLTPKMPLARLEGDLLVCGHCGYYRGTPTPPEDLNEENFTLIEDTTLTSRAGRVGEERELLYIDDPKAPDYDGATGARLECPACGKLSRLPKGVSAP